MTVAWPMVTCTLVFDATVPAAFDPHCSAVLSFVSGVARR